MLGRSRVVEQLADDGAQFGGAQPAGMEIRRTQLLGLALEHWVTKNNRGNARRLGSQHQVEAVVFAEFDFSDEKVGRRIQVDLSGRKRSDHNKLTRVAKQPDQLRGYARAWSDDQNVVLLIKGHKSTSLGK